MNNLPEILKVKLGYASDPAIETLLDRSVLVQIKVSKLENTIKELNNAINMLEDQREVFNMEIDLLKKEYNI